MLSKGFGGAERYFVDLCVALAEAGHQVQALCHVRSVARGQLAAAGLRVDTVHARGLWDVWSVRQMTRRVRAFDPALIHAHLARGAWAGGRIASRLGLPLVVKTHNYVKLKYYRHVDLFIPTTADQAAYLRAHGVSPERIARVPNFSSLPPVAELPARHPPPLRLAAYGRMVPKKGFGLLLEAFGRAVRAGHDMVLAIGGDGPQRAELARTVHRLALTERVRLPGWVDDVAVFLGEADVFVLPSLDEPFGIAVLEAMARGCPIVATRTRGPCEILDEHTATLVAPGDAGALARALMAVDRDADGARRKATAALGCYRECYHRDAVVPRLVALYRRLAEPAPAATSARHT